MNSHKLFTLNEILQLNPNGLKKYHVPPYYYPQHDPVTHESQFSQHEYNVLNTIVKVIREANPNQDDLQAWAIGSRVTGKWKTKQQSEELASQGYPLKYSDFDVATNAQILPPSENINYKLKTLGEIGHVVRFYPPPSGSGPMVELTVPL